MTIVGLTALDLHQHHMALQQHIAKTALAYTRAMTCAVRSRESGSIVNFARRRGFGKSIFLFTFNLRASTWTSNFSALEISILQHYTQTRMSPIARPVLQFIARLDRNCCTLRYVSTFGTAAYPIMFVGNEQDQCISKPRLPAHANVFYSVTSPPSKSFYVI